MRIRRFRDEDSRRVSYLIRKALYVSNSKDYPPKTTSDLIAYFSPTCVRNLSRQREMYVVEEGGRLMATGSLAGDWILTFFVSPRCQRRGVGTRLLAHLEGRASRDKRRRMFIPASFTAIRFYKARGYSLSRDQSMATEDVVIMEKRLLNTEPDGSTVRV